MTTKHGQSRDESPPNNSRMVEYADDVHMIVANPGEFGFRSVVLEGPEDGWVKVSASVVIATHGPGLEMAVLYHDPPTPDGSILGQILELRVPDKVTVGTEDAGPDGLEGAESAQPTGLARQVLPIAFLCFGTIRCGASTVPSVAMFVRDGDDPGARLAACQAAVRQHSDDGGGPQETTSMRRSWLGSLFGRRPRP